MHVVFSMSDRQWLQVTMPGLQLLIQVEFPPATFALQAIVEVVEHVEVAFTSGDFKIRTFILYHHKR